MRVLLLLAPALVCAQTLQFGAQFGGGCDSFVCNYGAAFYADTVTSIAIDSLGNSYIAGTSYGSGFPQVNPLQPVNPFPVSPGSQSIPFVAKIDPDGTKLVYATLIGTAQLFTAGTGLLPGAITVDAAGNAYVTGTAPAQGFPTVAGGVAPTSGGAFFIKLDPSGNLLMSTILGPGAGNSIALDSSGAIYIAGTISEPSGSEIFLARIDPASGNLTDSTSLGQGASPQLAVVPNGDVLLAATTTSSAWATTSGVVQPSCAGSPCADVVALRFRPSNSQIVYETYLGGSGVETLGGIAGAADGSLYLAGTTASSDFPVTPGALQTQSRCVVDPSAACGSKAFATKLSPTGTTLEYSTYLGGSMSDEGQAIAIDAAGNAYVAGQTTSSDFPVLRAIQPTLIPEACGVDIEPQSFTYCGGAGFLTVLNPQGAAINWSTYAGEYGSGLTNAGAFNGASAVALDASGNVYLAGDDLALAPVELNPGASTTLNRGPDASLLKIAQSGQPLDVISMSDAASLAPGLPYAGGLASLFVTGLTGINGTVTGSANPWPTKLAGVTVKVNGDAAPLLMVANLAVGEQQINFQVPFFQGAGPTGDSSPVVEIDFNGSRTFLGSLPSAPGIFTLSDGSPAVEHAADYSLVTSMNRISPGETIVIYVTGLGLVTPAGQTGVPFAGPAVLASGIQPAIVIGGVPCNVIYAGATPGELGLYQVNCQTSTELVGGLQPLQMIYQFNPLGLSMSPPPLASTASNVVMVPVQ